MTVNDREILLPRVPGGDHLTGAGSVLLFGAGVKEGFAHGEIAKEIPCATTNGLVAGTKVRYS